MPSPFGPHEDSVIAVAQLKARFSEQIDWLAGLLEGEGYFGLVRHHSRGYVRTYPRIGVSMTDLDIIERIATIWGVRIYHRKQRTYKLQHRATIQGQRAVHWMYVLFPLLGRRRQGQITNALREWEERRAAKRRSKDLAQAAAQLMRLPDGSYFPSLKDGKSRVNRRLSEPIVATIKGLLAAGVLQLDLARALGLSTANLSSIARGETWGYVQPADIQDLNAVADDRTPEQPNTNVIYTADSLGAKREEALLQVKRRTKQSETIRQELAELKQRQVVLEKLLGAYDDLDALEDQSRKTNKTAPQGTRSLRGAVLEVLSKADGPLKPKEIWSRAQALGAATRARNPVQVVDLAAYQLRSSGIPLEKGESGWFGDADELKRFMKL